MFYLSDLFIYLHLYFFYLLFLLCVPKVTSNHSPDKSFLKLFIICSLYSNSFSTGSSISSTFLRYFFINSEMS